MCFACVHASYVCFFRFKACIVAMQPPQLSAKPVFRWRNCLPRCTFQARRHFPRMPQLFPRVSALNSDKRTVSRVLVCVLRLWLRRAMHNDPGFVVTPLSSGKYHHVVSARLASQVHCGFPNQFAAVLSTACVAPR